MFFPHPVTTTTASVFPAPAAWLAGCVLAIVCCRLRPGPGPMPRHKACDEQYLQENYTIKENHLYSSQENCRRKNAEVQVQRASPPRSTAAQAQARPASYAGDAARRAPAPPPAHQYASSSVLDEAAEGGGAGGGGGGESLKTRSLPAFLRTRTRPLSATEPAAERSPLLPLLAKVQVSLSRRHKSRMRSEHAALIALSKSRGQLAAGAVADATDPDPLLDAVIVYDQRTRL